MLFHNTSFVHSGHDMYTLVSYQARFRSTHSKKLHALMLFQRPNNKKGQYQGNKLAIETPLANDLHNADDRFRGSHITFDRVF